MQIVVRDGVGTNIRLRIPTGLVLNRIIVLVARTVLKSQGIDVPREAALHFLAEIRTCQRHHRDWVLAEVHRSGGMEIIVIL